jgi:hypothetical protein
VEHKPPLGHLDGWVEEGGGRKGANIIRMPHANLLTFTQKTEQKKSRRRGKKVPSGGIDLSGTVRVFFNQ